MLPSEYLQKGWTRHHLATTSCGFPIKPTSSEAKNWCMEGAYVSAFASQNIEHYNIVCKLRNVLIVLISEKINNDKNIIRKFLNNVNYRSTNNTVAYWNDYDCKNQQEAIKLMQEAEKIIGLTPEKMISLQNTQINNIVNGQIEEILNNDPIAYVEKETVSV